MLSLPHFRIFLLLISTASMLCKLSYVSPTFRPALSWQPWCKLCTDCGSSKPSADRLGDVERPGKKEGLLTSELFEELVKKHENDPYIDDTLDTSTDKASSQMDLDRFQTSRDSASL